MDLNQTDELLKIDGDKPAKSESLTVAMELFSGGNWLGACRTWMQNNLPRGDQITWGDDKQCFAITPKQLESMAYRVAVAAVNAERAAPKPPKFMEDKPVIHFVVECMAANSERPQSRRRNYKVDIFASTLEQAQEAYYEQTLLYEVSFGTVCSAELCNPSDIQSQPNVLQGLRLHNGAFLIESSQEW